LLILIDGYNLIRQSDILRNYERQSLEAGRRALISKLIEYEKRRGHKITVVSMVGKTVQQMKNAIGPEKLILFIHATVKKLMTS